MKYVLVKKAKDNVGNALEHIMPGDDFRWEADGREHSHKALTEVRFAFKIALRDIGEGETVLCYGEPIGVATAPIRAGECVHIHNIQGRRANN